MANIIDINSNYLKEIKYQREINKNISQCLTCERRCKIKRGEIGFCGTRINKVGIIYSMVYGCIPAISINPIEKKPLYHFYPGSFAITVGTYGCNFSCFWCQNHHLSHPSTPIIELIKKRTSFLSPEDLIQNALEKKCQGTSISFNEPTLLFEYSLEVFKLAKKESLYNTYVSNGYMTKNVLRDLVDNGLDAINIDIKGDTKMVKKYCGIDIENVWRNAKLAKELGVHVEITTLLINKENTEEKIIEDISKRILKDLGKDTPFHITRAYPHYRSINHGFNKPTPIILLEKAYKIAKKAGLDFVYIGNLSNSNYENTICPNCLETIIKRKIFGIEKLLIDDEGKCKFCGFKISII